MHRARAHVSCRNSKAGYISRALCGRDAYQPSLEYSTEPSACHRGKSAGRPAARVAAHTRSAPPGDASKLANRSAHLKLVAICELWLARFGSVHSWTIGNGRASIGSDMRRATTSCSTELGRRPGAGPVTCGLVCEIFMRHLAVDWPSRYSAPHLTSGSTFARSYHTICGTMPGHAGNPLLTLGRLTKPA